MKTISSTIKITSDCLKGKIDPFIYGNFVEFLDDHVSGMWAEKIKNRKFEDSYCDLMGVPRPWRASGYNTEAIYLLDCDAFSVSAIKHFEI